MSYNWGGVRGFGAFWGVEVCHVCESHNNNLIGGGGAGGGATELLPKLLLREAQVSDANVLET